LGTVRPEEIGSDHPLTTLHLALRQSRQLKELELASLSAAETAVLAAQLTPNALKPSETDRLYQETEGNPLFIIEMMHAGLPQSQTLPATIQAAIQSRFVHLTPQARELMAQAAVIGRAFDYHLLAGISGLAEESLINSLDELWRRRIIREHGGSDYDFSHDKIREVAYAELSQTRRHWLHRRVAQSLVARHASNLEAYSGQIAAHYEMAQMPAEAIAHYLLSAKAAQHLYANAEAISTIRRALQLLATAPRTADPEWGLDMTAKLQECLGDLLHFTAHYEEARTAYGLGLTAVTQTTLTPDPIWLCRLQRKIGSAYLPQHQYDQASSQFEQAKSALGVEPIEPNETWWHEWIDLQQERKYLFYWLNQWPEIAAILEESRPILAQHGTPTQQAFFFDPSMFYRRDRYAISDEVLGYTREWFAANIALGDPAHQGATHFLLGFSLLWYGDFAEAQTALHTALTMADQSGDLNLRARSLTYLTVAYRKQEQMAQVRDHIAPCIAAAKAAEMPEYVATAHANLAWVNWRDGDEQKVLQNGRSALTLWHTLLDHYNYPFQWAAYFPLMAIALAQQNLDEAITHVQSVLDPSQQKLAEEVTTVLQNALTAHQQNQPLQTTELLQRAITLAQQFHYL
jgi:hypothetical protein